jgi:hypothetical protein
MTGLTAQVHSLESANAKSSQTTVPVAGDPFLAGPPQGDGPVKVTVNFDLREIDHIDDDEENFEFTGVLKLSWHDPRQAFDPVTAGVDEKIYQGEFQFNELFPGWFPQLILVNESGHYEKRGVLLRVRSDGSVNLFETINAVAKVDLDLQRYPVDRQQLDAVFHVLGFNNNEIVLRLDDEYDYDSPDVKASIMMPQWQLTKISASIGTRKTPLIGKDASTSTFTTSVHVQRDSFFIFRLVILPLMVIVILSWSVFWMDKSSLGDRLSISFIGILTAVTYQVIMSEILPRISYVTLINDGFLAISFFTMTMTVLVNLRVGYLDRGGNSLAGDRLDQHCRWIFPLAYFGSLVVIALIAFL